MGERSMNEASRGTAAARAILVAGLGLGVLLGAGCASGSSGATGAARQGPPAPTPGELRQKVVADFEAAILSGREAFVGLFDFAAVGEMEILLHRYDLNGRLPNLDDRQKADFAAEDGTPYPAERERRNVGNFYKLLGQRTVGTGGCAAREPRTRYAKLLATFPPLPEGTPPKYEALRAHASEWAARGGLVGLACGGGRGGLALVYAARDTARGYDLITIYDD